MNSSSRTSANPNLVAGALRRNGNALMEVVYIAAGNAMVKTIVQTVLTSGSATHQRVELRSFSVEPEGVFSLPGNAMASVIAQMDRMKSTATMQHAVTTISNVQMEDAFARHGAAMGTTIAVTMLMNEAVRQLQLLQLQLQLATHPHLVKDSNVLMEVASLKRSFATTSWIVPMGMTN